MCVFFSVYGFNLNLMPLKKIIYCCVNNVKKKISERSRNFGRETEPVLDPEPVSEGQNPGLGLDRPRTGIGIRIGITLCVYIGLVNGRV